jgi:hypothetical protein
VLLLHCNCQVAWHLAATHTASLTPCCGTSRVRAHCLGCSEGPPIGTPTAQPAAQRPTHALATVARCAACSDEEWRCSYQEWCLDSGRADCSLVTLTDHELPGLTSISARAVPMRLACGRTAMLLTYATPSRLIHPNAPSLKGFRVRGGTCASVQASVQWQKLRNKMPPASLQYTA